MRHLLRNSILIIVVLSVCAMSLYPPKEKLRLGKDLAGGASLVYNVEVKPDDPPDVIERTIEVLKDRVNPNGLFEIDFRKQGSDQIEIAMPLPNEEVKQLRREYDAELAKLHDYEIDIDAFELAMRKSGAEREQALRPMMDTPARTALLQPIDDALKTVQEARAAYNAALAGADEAEKTRLLEAAGAAEVTLDSARQRLLGSLIDHDDVRAKLELSDEPHKIKDKKTNTVKEFPSERSKALEGIRSRLSTIPGGTDLLDSILAKHKAYADKRKGLDDPADLQRLLQGSGVLTFRIGVGPSEVQPAELQRLRDELRARGADLVQATGMRWFPINKLASFYDSVEQYEAMQTNVAGYFAGRGLIAEARDGQTYILLYDQQGLRLTKAEGDWSLASAGQGTDQLGRPAITFRTDTVGQSLMGDLTEKNIGRQMSILLDDRIYTSANINSRIPGNGIIEGTFTQEEINYVIKTMSAGSLQAKLGAKPVSVSTQAPELGKDNLARGLKATYISFIAVGIFMLIYYFIPGAVAIVGMLTTGLMVMGIMALQQAAFTLPGIAGIALTFGMAVDSNVLIYERLREEITAGRDLKTALRLAYQRAGAAIIDANITTLITAIVLGYTGTPEIKGFAISLGIGVVATMFMALVITRVILVLLVEKFNIEATKFSLPLVVPAIQRLLTPRVSWLNFRHVFYAFSIGMVLMGFFFIYTQGAKMLDSEFRGGTQVTLDLRDPKTRQPVELTRSAVEERVHAIAKDPEASGNAQLQQLLTADIVPINAKADGVTSNTFIVRTTADDAAIVGQAIVEEFKDVLETTPALVFSDADIEKTDAGAPVYAIYEPALGANINRPEVKNNVDKFVGGAAIVLDGLDRNVPVPTRDELVRRLDQVRDQGAFPSATRRDHALIVIDGDNSAVKSAVIVVSDPRINAYEKAKWQTELAEIEWALVRESLTKSATPAGIQSFSPQIAQSFRAQAIVATILSFLFISIYVWVRFGSARYAAAALVPLVHDVLIVVGMIALAEVLYDKFPGLASFGIRPYKIDMGMVAAIMTIIGYSLNDTIVVLDRIRENRGKLAYASQHVIDLSINQTMSRTIITGGGVIFTLIVLLTLGGQAIASFAYTLLVGVIIGTYSSFAVAAPFVWTKNPPAAATLMPRTTPDAEPEPGEGPKGLAAGV